MTFASQAKRTSSLLAAIGFAFATIASVIILAQGQASAYTGLGARSIQLSNSTSPGSGQVLVSFTTLVTQTTGSVVIEYCSNSPIIGDSCTAPTGLDVNEGTVAVSGQSGSIGALTVHANTTTNRLVLTTTPASAAAGAQSFTLGTGGLTNPTTGANTTFYARISTHAAATGADADMESGGVALSTAAQLVITAKVQETLTFCVYTLANCGAGGTAVDLGDGNGVLSNTAIDYEDTGKFDLGTNAQGGAVVMLKGPLPTSGSFTIASQGTTCTADSTTATDEDFGLRVVETAPVVADTAYDCAANFHSFDATAAATTYGDVIANTATDPLDTVTSTVEYSAKAGTSTEAGVYIANHTFIATGTY